MSSTGEGSRGGHVIGHTKSGKPVYAPQSGINPVQHVKDTASAYSQQDHRDAANIHYGADADALDRGDMRAHYAHQDVARAHEVRG